MGDEYLIFNQMIKKIEFIFRFSGFNIRSGAITTSNVQSRIIFITNNLWVNSALWGEICWLTEGVISGYDFFGLTHNAPCMLLTLLSTIKGLLLVLNEKRVHKLIEKLRNMERREKEREETKKNLEIIDTEKNFLNTVLKSITLLYLVVFVAFALMPLLIMYLNYSKTGQLELVLPFLIWYPFDPFNMNVYPLVYLHQIWAETVVALFICSNDFIFFTCCTYIRIQFKLLQESIENLIPVEKGLNCFCDNNEFKEKVRELILWHQDLIESTLLLEEIYSKSALLNFFTSSFIICLTGFNVMMVNEVVVAMGFLSFLFMGLFQVFFICFFADLLTVASTEVSEAVYKSQWYMADVRVGKQLHLIQIRGHNPCKLTAFGFADVNLNSFMRVLSTAWSYFALLKKIYE